jgi:hypothetical protein
VLTPTFIGTQTQTVDETTTTWTGIGLGSTATPHPKRIVVVAGHHGVAAAATATLNGDPYFMRVQNTTYEFSMFAFFCPFGDAIDLSVSATGSIRKAFAIYVLYPHHPVPLITGSASAGTTTNATIANFIVHTRGCVIYAGGQHATLGAFTTTLSGQTVTEDVDTQYESASSYTMGRITSVSPSSNTNALTLAETVSGTKRLVGASWGPAWPHGRVT